MTNLSKRFQITRKTAAGWVVLAVFGLMLLTGTMGRDLNTVNDSWGVNKISRPSAASSVVENPLT